MPLPAACVDDDDASSDAADDDDGTESAETVIGHVALEGSGNFTGHAANCRGTGGFDDFRSGTRATIRDGDGDVLATASLDHTFSEEESTESELETFASVGGCQVKFEVGVPEADFYSIEVGSRGETTYSYNELEDADWIVRLSLG